MSDAIVTIAAYLGQRSLTPAGLPHTTAQCHLTILSKAVLFCLNHPSFRTPGSLSFCCRSFCRHGRRGATFSVSLSAVGFLSIESDTVASSIVEDLETQLSETRELLSNREAKLSETRERLSKVQEALTVAEQLTAATQQRELQEEKLQLELFPQHQLTRHSGISWRLILLLFYFVTFFGEAKNTSKYQKYQSIIQASYQLHLIRIV